MPHSRTPSNAPEASPGTVDFWLYEHTDLVAFLLVAIGFFLRLREASGTFLNPDEALHFAIANQPSFSEAYRASLTLAHPPLLIFVMHFWRTLGTSEIILRLPSVIAGSAFCWIFFRWLKATLGPAAALVGTIFISLLPPLVVLSAEIRQYSLLLFFAASAALLLERGLQESSAWRIGLASICLWLAMLSHYSGLLFAAAFGIYSLMRMVRNRPPANVMAAWLLGQFIAAAIIAYLYAVQISRLKDSGLAQQAMSEWLRRSYFHRGHDNLLTFIFGRSFAVFQFVFGQHVVGDIAGLLFLVGVVVLLREKFVGQPSTPTRQFGMFLLLPFAVNCILAIVDRYPYGGTRHSVFLAMFALAGVSTCVVWAVRRLIFAVALALSMIAACYAFGFHHQPYIPRDDQDLTRMRDAMQFIRTQIPPDELILVDYESDLMLGHYLCGQKPAVIGVSDFQSFRCDNHQIISAAPLVWMFDAQSFPKIWDEFVAKYQLRPGTHVWIVQAGWGAAIAPALEHKPSDISPEQQRSFGHNISAFRLTVAQNSVALKK